MQPLATSVHTARQEVMLEMSALGNPSHCPLGMYVIPDPTDAFSESSLPLRSPSHC